MNLRSLSIGCVGYGTSGITKQKMLLVGWEFGSFQGYHDTVVRSAFKLYKSAITLGTGLNQQQVDFP